MPSFKLSKMTGGKDFSVPPGLYQLEIKEAKHYDASGYDMLNLNCEIIEPADQAGRLLYLSLFYTDYKVVELIETVSKKTIKEFNEGKDDLDEKKVFGLLTNEFIKVRLGVKEHNGTKRNMIAEIVNEKGKEESKLEV